MQHLKDKMFKDDESLADVPLKVLNDTLIFLGENAGKLNEPGLYYKLWKIRETLNTLISCPQLIIQDTAPRNESNVNHKLLPQANRTLSYIKRETVKKKIWVNTIKEFIDDTFEWNSPQNEKYMEIQKQLESQEVNRKKKSKTWYEAFSEWAYKPNLMMESVMGTGRLSKAMAK